MPSLHAAYSSITAYYAIHKYGIKKAGWVIIYPLGVYVAAVYLNHHFIVDLILGVIYMAASIKIVRLYHNYREQGSKYSSENGSQVTKDEEE